MAGYMTPSQAESDAMAAFLAKREGSLEERIKQIPSDTWSEFIAEWQKQMKEKTKQGAGDGKD